MSTSSPPRPKEDACRIQALHDLKILDTPREERFDRLTREIAEKLGVPIAYVALIDAERQWLKSKVGGLETEVERDQSFCTYALMEERPLVVPDAIEDPRFKDNPMVTGEPFLRFYAGVPIKDPSGETIGTVCIADVEPKEISYPELEMLEDYAGRVQQEINAKPSVFISYAHEDEAWKDRLVVHCSILERQGLLDIWNDRRIGAGEDWYDGIRVAVERAKVAILLVSADFLASDFILREEVPRLIERRDKEGLVILPLVLKPCMWSQVDWLASMNLRPNDGRPVLGGSDIEIDNDLSEFASEIAQVVQKVARRLQADELPPGVAPAPPAAPVPRTAAPADILERLGPGSKLGGYEILELRRQGRSGDVYLARDPRMNRKLVLKVLNPELASDPERVARFQREAEAVAAINHPNIVNVFSVEEDRGVHFFTREMVEGRSLDEIVRQGPLPLDRFLDVAVRLTDVLVAAHLRGFVHRDLKPAHVVVTEEGRVKLLDLGMTKLLEGRAERETRVQSLETLAGDGFFAETISYMSPEQVARQPVDHRTDVYSLGVILFEMATGRKPFTGLSPMDLLSAVMREEPQKVTEVDGDLPDRLAAIIHRCLEKDPERRYASTFDLLKELEGLKAEQTVAEQTVAAKATSETVATKATSETVAVPAPVAGQDAGRGKWPLLAAAALVAFLTLAGVVFWVSRDEEGSGAAAAGDEVASVPAGLPAADADAREPSTAAALEAQAPPSTATSSPPPPPAPPPPAVTDRTPTTVAEPPVRKSSPPPEPVPPPASRQQEPPPPSAPPEEPSPVAPPPAAATPAAPPPEPAGIEPAPVAAPPAAADPVAVEPESRQPTEEQRKEAILATLRAYATASNALDAAAVKRVMPEASERQLEKSFSELRSKEVDIRGCDIRFFSPTVAAAICRERVKIVPKRGITPPPQENTIVFKLESRGDSWIVTDRSLAD